MKRSTFGSKFGMLAAAVGSAVGLGNIWKFPYLAGENGGGAFIIVYLLCVLFLGVPALLSELSLGYIGRSNGIGAMRNITGNNRWGIIGILGFLGSFIILGFYFVVAGWSLEFVYQSVMGEFVGQSGEVITQNFDTFRFDTWRPYLWIVAFIVLTAGVLYAGVEKGIEKWSKVLMPMLFAIVVYLCVYSIFLPNSSAGYKFYFDFDFSKITANVIIAALGQAFFSLSLGMGAMMIYGSYIEKGTNLAKTSIQIASLDTLVAILAGLVVFPAVFSYGIDPAAGPQLVFITLPTVFAQMTGGYFFSVFFFLLVAVAALTSTISILEVQIATVAEEFKMNRKLSLVLMSVVMLVVCSMCSYSLIPIEEGNELTLFGKSMFDICDILTSYIILPLGGLLIMLFLGWFYKKEDLHYILVVETKCSEGLFKIYYFFLRFIAPLLLLVVFLQQLGVF